MNGLSNASLICVFCETLQMGYAQLKQRGHGIHTRQYARTFIVEDSANSRIVYVSVDAGMISHAVKRNVIIELRKKYGKTYRFDNVMISGTRKFFIHSRKTDTDIQRNGS